MQDQAAAQALLAAIPRLRERLVEEVWPSRLTVAREGCPVAAARVLREEREERGDLGEEAHLDMGEWPGVPEAEAALGSLMVATEAIRERDPREEVEDHRPNPVRLQALEGQAA